jgi:hypothetical protein
MDLDVLKRTAKEDLPVTDQEHIDQESYKNQMIKRKWLDFKADFELLLIKAKTDHHCIDTNGNTMAVRLRQKYTRRNHLTSRL